LKDKEVHISISLVGMGNHDQPSFTTEIQTVISSHVVFSGGKRHYDIVRPYLPKKHQWIFIKGEMDALIAQYCELNVPMVIFTSGDPLFYGFGNTLQRLLPTAELIVYPYFNSIQRLCHKTQTNYNQLKSVSVHGRDWSALDVALIDKETLIGVLTDGKKTPAVIAQRMLQYGFTNYSITVGEELDGKEEQISELSLEVCTKKEFSALNNVLLKRTQVLTKQLGNADADFVHLPNRANMITKMPIRLTTLHTLKLKEGEVFWDVGACTGAVAIEAKKYEPTIKVVAFEKRNICKEIIQQNKERFSVPGIEVVIEDFFELDLQHYPCPDVVFIGGHGNRLEEMLHIVSALNPKVRFVTNAVKEKTSSVFLTVLKAKGYQISTIDIQVNEHNKIKIHATVNV